MPFWLDNWHISQIQNIIAYKWASYRLVLMKCAVFDNAGVQGTAQTTASGFLPPSIESFRFIIAPDSDCEGYPLTQLFFRGACGLDDVWNNWYTPGTIDPFNNYTKSGRNMHINVNDYSGYSIGKEVEYNYVVRDPSKFLNFSPFQQ